MDKNRLYSIWRGIYGDTSNETGGDDVALLDSFIQELDSQKKKLKSDGASEWYKDAVVYSAYVDLFNEDFEGLKEKLPYLEGLGVNCLWLLPILNSPMKDAGFDISDYRNIRQELLGEKGDMAVFDAFIEEAHNRGIRLIFDIAMNHCSVEHPWFESARKSKDSEYRDYFIWSEDAHEYKDARIIFKGLCESNWAYDEVSSEYYFHRFFEIQPDLNYRNPQVLLEMTRVLTHWKLKGIDGFRADAVPYIWKEEGTICENLPKTHLVVKFFRAVLDYLSPGSLLLAEACQPPSEVVAYFGDDDECNAAYHFPVMPMIYHAMASCDKRAIENVMHTDFTPQIPKNSQWFMFLRCHDELTLEMVTPEERKFIYDHYVKDSIWDFREGEGISARLAELFEFNPQRILLAYSIMLTLPGTPIVYYGDEVAKGNDVEFYEACKAETGYADSRYLGRGKMDWKNVDEILSDESSVGSIVYNSLKQMIHLRNQNPVFGRGTNNFIDLTGDAGDMNPSLLAYRREYEGQSISVVQNLSDKTQSFTVDSVGSTTKDLISGTVHKPGDVVTLAPHGFCWMK